VDKIFRGANPVELLIELSTAFEFVINPKDREGARAEHPTFHSARRRGDQEAPAADVAIGPKPKCRDVRDLVAIGWKADMATTP
jgi:hypothetical protein